MALESASVPEISPRLLHYRKFGLFDISYVFNQIQLMAETGEVTPLYLEIPYQIGLAMQLFGILLFGGIRLPDAVRYRAEINIIWVQGERRGFWIERELEPGSFNCHRDLYIFGLSASLQHQGHGRTVLNSIIDRLPAGCCLQTECYPSSFSTRHLLMTCGFHSLPVSPDLRGKIHSYIYSKAGSVAEARPSPAFSSD